MLPEDIEGDLTKVEASAQAAQDDLHTLRVRLDRGLQLALLRTDLPEQPFYTAGE